MANTFMIHDMIQLPHAHWLGEFPEQGRGPTIPTADLHLSSNHQFSNPFFFTPSLEWKSKSKKININHT